MVIDSPVDLSGVLASWTWAPGWDLLVLLAVSAYAVLAGRSVRRGARWPVGRSAAAGSAALALVLTMNGPLAVFAPALFWVHMLQHLMLIMVVPVLVVYAQPLRLWRTVSAPRATARGRWFQRPVTSPMATIPLYAAVLAGTHLTGFQEVMLGHMWVHEFESALYLVTGYLLFGGLVGADLWPWRLPYLVRFATLGLTMGIDAFVGVVLMLTSDPIAPAFASRHPGWGPGALADQSAAGAVMWFGGDGLMMILMIATAIEWGRAGAKEQSLGSWLEGIRSRELLGHLDVGEYVALGDVDDDDDDRALRTYNAMLARLHGSGDAGPQPRTQDEAPSR
ncbi:cytochrome c oxidase assembly protein [Nakamurella sp. UYEF19]|uniref:cytochrome c oxidase assembly protein n=1 Tax=Nakamurella sp. UYEF19 TaxID=1756392 RepID=UPI0033944C92